MRIRFFALILLFLPSLGIAGRRSRDLALATGAASAADKALTNTPSLSPEETTLLRKEKADAVGKIETIANSEPKDTETQLAVSKSLASVSEAPRAIPYAERGLKLAEASGDQKMIRDALLIGSEVYYRAGNFELARERAQRVLKLNPRDKDAMALYMLVKDRGAGTSATPARGEAGGGDRLVLTNDGGRGSVTMTALGQPNVVMTNTSSMEAQKQIAMGWSRMKLDAKAALRNFDAAVAADPKGAAARVQRSKARLEAGDLTGAHADANDAVMLDPKLGAAYAARAEVDRAIGKATIELLADYETAAKLDGNFTAAYKAALLQSGGGESSGNGGMAGSSAPDGPRGLLARSPKNWSLYALVCVLLAVVGGIVVPLMLKRRRSGGDDSLPR